jgi:hypothetical protein
MKSNTFAKRLVSRSALLVQASALCLCALPAMAALVDSGPVSIAIPDDADGLYLNVVTGASGGAGGGVAGWDVNPYSATPGTSFNLWGPTTTTWFNPQAVVGGNYNLPGGTVIQGAAAAFFRPGSGTNVGTQVTLNSDQNFLGFRFANEANAGAIHFGYIQVQFGATASTRTIVRYVYDNVADTAVTVPAGVVNTAPTLTYSPTTAAGVTFAGGPAGSVSSTIAITSASASGTGQSAVTGCAITGAGAASFGAVTTTPANGIFNTTTTTGSIDLTCTRGAMEATATLACTETATPTVAGSPFTRSWTLTCPAATAAVSPGIASGTSITLPRVNLPSTSSSSPLSFTASGSAASVTCSTTGAGFSVAPSPLNLTVGVAGSVTVSYTGSTPGTYTGTLNCTTTATGGPFTYPLSATIGAATVARTVPTTGAVATWFLILSVLGIGMVFGARNRS